jgi:hypothetical protein
MVLEEVALHEYIARHEHQTFRAAIAAYGAGGVGLS